MNNDVIEEKALKVGNQKCKKMAEEKTIVTVLSLEDV